MGVQKYIPNKQYILDSFAVDLYDVVDIRSSKVLIFERNPANSKYYSRFSISNRRGFLNWEPKSNPHDVNLSDLEAL